MRTDSSSTIGAGGHHAVNTLGLGGRCSAGWLLHLAGGACIVQSVIGSCDATESGQLAAVSASPGHRRGQGPPSASLAASLVSVIVSAGALSRRRGTLHQTMPQVQRPRISQRTWQPQFGDLGSIVIVMRSFSDASRFVGVVTALDYHKTRSLC